VRSPIPTARIRVEAGAGRTHEATRANQEPSATRSASAHHAQISKNKTWGGCWAGPPIPLTACGPKTTRSSPRGRSARLSGCCWCGGSPTRVVLRTSHPSTARVRTTCWPDPRGVASSVHSPRPRPPPPHSSSALPGIMDEPKPAHEHDLPRRRRSRRPTERPGQPARLRCARAWLVAAPRSEQHGASPPPRTPAEGLPGSAHRACRHGACGAFGGAIGDVSRRRVCRVNRQRLLSALTMAGFS